MHRIAEVMRRIAPTAQTIVYGSEARGDARQDSDIDLLILLDDSEEPTPERELEISRLEKEAFIPFMTFLLRMMPQRKVLLLFLRQCQFSIFGRRNAILFVKHSIQSARRIEAATEGYRLN